MKIIKVLFFILLYSFSSYAQETYNVQKVLVSVEGENAKIARELAIKQFAKDALIKLLANINQQDVVHKLDPKKIEENVVDFEIVKEKISPNSYKAIVNVTFSKSGVNGLLSSVIAAEELSNLSSQTLSTQDESSSAVNTNHQVAQYNKILILPLLRSGSEIKLWEDENLWIEAFRVAMKKKLNSSFVIPQGDMQDIQSINPSNLLSANFSDFNDLVSRYEAKKIVILIADILPSQNSDIKKLDLSIRILDEKNQDNFLQFYNSYHGNSEEELLNMAAESVIRSGFNSRAIKKIEARGADQSVLGASVIAENILEWVEIENKLKQINIIEKIEVESLMLKQVNIKIYYYADLEEIITAMKNSGIFVEEKNNQYYLGLV